MIGSVDPEYLLLGVASALLSLVTWIKYRGLEYVIKNYRWVFVCLFLLPLSVVYDLVMYVRNWVIFKLNSAPKKHTSKVNYVQKQVKKHPKSFSFVFFKLNLAQGYKCMCVLRPPTVMN